MTLTVILATLEHAVVLELVGLYAKISSFLSLQELSFPDNWVFGYLYLNSFPVLLAV